MDSLKENKPFECPVVLDKIKVEREKLIASLSDFNIPEDEKQFILRKINNMSEKLVRAGRYAKDSYED